VSPRLRARTPLDSPAGAAWVQEVAAINITGHSEAVQKDILDKIFCSETYVLLLGASGRA
jgi:hypothetical protein